MSKLYSLFLFFIALWGFSVSQTVAQTTADSLVIQVTDDEGKLEDLNRYLHVFEDITQKLAISDITKEENNHRFILLSKRKKPFQLYKTFRLWT